MGRVRGRLQASSKTFRGHRIKIHGNRSQIGAPGDLSLDEDKKSR